MADTKPIARSTQTSVHGTGRTPHFPLSGFLYVTNSLSDTQSGSTSDPPRPHGLNLIHRVSDAP